MRSKNKPKPSKAEAAHIERIKEMACIVCDASGPSDCHEPEQGLWFISMPLCKECHQGKDGWHGTRLRWRLRKMTELLAINETLRKLA